MKHKPYQEVIVKGETYWDYSFKIKGIIYEISVDQNTGILYINKDEDQNKSI